MQVHVTYRGQIKQAAGISRESVAIEKPCTARDLAVRVARERGEPLESMLLDGSGELRAHILLVVGNEHVPPESAALLKDGDELTILPPMAGG